MQPCPSCGYCPTCGRRSYHDPFYYQAPAVYGNVPAFAPFKATGPVDRHETFEQLKGCDHQ